MTTPPPRVPPSSTPPPSSPSSSSRSYSQWPLERSVDPNAPSPWLKWSATDPGTVRGGVWSGRFQGRYGPCAKLTLTCGRELKFSLPTVLEKRVAGVPVGAAVSLTYLGLTAGKVDEGKAYYDFDVEVDLASIPDRAALADDEVPF
jgi:hypothetical protein